MAPLQQLISFHIIENNFNNQLLFRWTFPQISKESSIFLLQKITALHFSVPFLCIKYKNDWIYIVTTEVMDNEILNQVKYFSIVLYTKDYDPNKYESLGKVFRKKYLKTGNPVDLVKLFLSVFTTGTCSIQENGSILTQDFDSFYSTGSTKVKELISNFGLETILIYTCLLLKKRIAIYHHNLDVLQKLMPTVATLMLHRNPNDYLYPHLDFSPESLMEIKGKNWYLAGFTDINICSKTDLFDLLVNFPAGEISISPNAKEVLSMTKTQKDVAVFMVQLADNKEKTEAQIVEEVSNKTEELLNQLKSLATTRVTEHNYMISMENLKSKKFNTAMENFLFNFAIAENIMLL